MKRFFTAGLAVVTIAMIGSASADMKLEDFSSGLSGGGSIITGSDGSVVSNFSLYPEVHVGNFGMGLNVNIALPDNKKPADHETIVVRFAEYENDAFGARWGVIDNLTLGAGLLMKNYSTTGGGSSILTNKQTGLKFKLKAFDPIVFTALGTATSVYGARFEERVSDDFVFGKPLILGQTYLVDVDGVAVKTGSGATTTLGQNQAAMGVDAVIPIQPNFLSLYAEAAQLVNYSSGFATGASIIFSTVVDFKAEYRLFGGGFVPEYFNYYYETAPINLSTASGTRKNGFLSTLGLNIMDGYMRFEGTYENYTLESTGKQAPSLTAALGFKEIQNVSGVIYYDQPNFTSLTALNSDNAAIRADINYRVNNWQSVVVHYKKIYVTPTNVSESYILEYSMNIPTAW